MPYEELATYVRKLARRSLGAGADADDVVQQVLFSVLRHGSELRDRGALRGWVRAITFSVVADVIRRRRTWRVVELDAARQRSGDLVRTVEMRELLARLQSMIERLPPAEQSAFVMRYVEGRKVNEVARSEGYSRATARRRLVRAERILKTLATQMAS